jgi:phosphatidylglycerophosphate synthase
MVQTGPAVGVLGLFGLLTELSLDGRLTLVGWLVGLGCAALGYLTLSGALARRAGFGLGPADRVTLLRAVLVGGVAALAAGSGSRAVLVFLAVIALVLDAVDGQVARRTRTVSALGARFDLEVDAFLILVLSCYLARPIGGWVLAIGLARYLFVVAGWLLPALREPSPPRYWCKVVAAIQGIVLTAAVILPVRLSELLLVVALLLLAESFGRQAWWLLRHAQAHPVPVLLRAGSRL